MSLLVLGQHQFNGILDAVPALSRKMLAAMATRLREADEKAMASVCVSAPPTGGAAKLPCPFPRLDTGGLSHARHQEARGGADRYGGALVVIAVGVATDSLGFELFGGAGAARRDPARAVWRPGSWPPRSPSAWC